MTNGETGARGNGTDTPEQKSTEKSRSQRAAFLEELGTEPNPRDGRLRTEVESCAKKISE